MCPLPASARHHPKRTLGFATAQLHRQEKLLGQTPEAALSAAAHSIKFFRQQEELAAQTREDYHQARERKAEARMAKV